MAELDLDNPAWRYIVALYGRDGVAPECLRLQDEFGIDISFALFCLWLGAERGISLQESSLGELRRMGREWAELAVAPLRQVRRAIKQSDFLNEAPVAALRKALAKLEIEAERIEIALLHRRAGEIWPASLRGPSLEDPSSRSPQSLTGSKNPYVRHAEERSKSASRSTQDRCASFETPAARALQDDEVGRPGSERVQAAMANLALVISRHGASIDTAPALAAALDPSGKDHQ